MIDYTIAPTLTEILTRSYDIVCRRCRCEFKSFNPSKRQWCLSCRKIRAKERNKKSKDKKKRRLAYVALHKQ